MILGTYLIIGALVTIYVFRSMGLSDGPFGRPPAFIVMICWPFFIIIYAFFLMELFFELFERKK